MIRVNLVKPPIWLRAYYKTSPYIDLLDDEIFNKLNANPKLLLEYIPSEHNNFQVITVSQKSFNKPLRSHRKI